MHVLVVGDKEAERAVLREAVHRLGHELSEAADGDQGWQAYLEHAPQIILSDFIMPGKNGLELCRAVREQPFEHYTYFVLLSTLSERAHILDGLRSGADDYLPKPVDVEELELRLLAARRVTELHARLAQQRNELEALSQKLLDESRKDTLTQVGNRLKFNDDARGLLDAYSRYGHAYTLAICDIDYFKQYNDTYGHLKGDEILCLVASHLEQSTRASDQVYRFGGEEFLIVFAEQGPEVAQIAAERLRREIEGLDVPHAGNPRTGKLTITFGLAPLCGADQKDLERTLQVADEALYAGKNAGRNQVVVHRQVVS